MIFNDKRGNLRNIERFELLAFCHSSSAGRRFVPYTAHQTSLARAVAYIIMANGYTPPVDPPVHLITTFRCVPAAHQAKPLFIRSRLRNPSSRLLQFQTSPARARFVRSQLGGYSIQPSDLPSENHASVLKKWISQPSIRAATLHIMTCPLLSNFRMRGRSAP